MIFKKPKKIAVQDASVTVQNVNGVDYLSLTDMIKSKDGDFFVSDWLRNRNTLEFLAVWEKINNPDFNYGEFDLIKQNAGLNNFRISVKEWVSRTNATGIISKPGRYGGTYAHRDIAFEFGAWINPVFKLYLFKEYQRLKEVENHALNQEWDVQRLLSKMNYQLHTDAIKDHIIPTSTKWRKEWEYAEEADFINIAVFGMTAKEWRNQNSELARKGDNIRSSASINELAVVSNLSSLNAELIYQGVSKELRLEKLREMALRQLKSLYQHDPIKSLKKLSDETYVIAKESSKQQ